MNNDSARELAAYRAHELASQTNDIAAKTSGAIVTRTKVLHIWNICPSLN